MTTSGIPEITDLSAEQLLTLRNHIDERLDAAKKSKCKPRATTKEE